MASGFATAAADEVSRLHQLVESLELANGTLNEKLIESHLETNALRRASDEGRGQMLLAQKAMIVDDKTEEQQQRQLGGVVAPEESGRDKPWVDDTSSACGLMLSPRDQQLDRSDHNEDPLVTDKASKDDGQEGRASLGGQRKGQNLTALGNSPVNDILETDRASAETPADARGGNSQPVRDPGYEPDEEPSASLREGGSRWAVVPPSPSRVFRRLPSISELPDEQAELIDALRGQVDQLRLEAQRAGSVTFVTGTGMRRRARRTRREELQDGGRGSRTKHSSDEDSSSGSSDNGNDNRNISGNDGGGFESSPPPVSSSLKTAGKESSAVSGVNVNVNVNVDDDQTVQTLQARVRDLSAELLTANLNVVTLRKQAQTDRAEIVRLQRENLSSHRLGLNSAMVAAAAARASSTAASSSA
ncbi:unnamed protein product, partial [Laminaria digitata]